MGGVVSPVLANLFMHYAFDAWMDREFPAVPFERYADDAVIHCVSEAQAKFVLEAVRRRLRDKGLELHPDKTRIVYCKDGRRGRRTMNNALSTFWVIHSEPDQQRRGMETCS